MKTAIRSFASKAVMSYFDDEGLRPILALAVTVCLREATSQILEERVRRPTPSDPLSETQAP